MGAAMNPIGSTKVKFKTVSASCVILLVMIAVLSAFVARALHAQAPPPPPVSAQSQSGQYSAGSTSLTTPRRPPPVDRYDYRGEHAGVIYTAGGWREMNVDPALIGPEFFTPLPGRGGLSVYLPYVHAYDSQRQPPVALGSSYEIVRPQPQGNASTSSTTSTSKTGAGAAPTGHYEARAREVVIPGQFVEVYHPAVYEVDDTGKEQLVEKEETTRVPKVRLVMTRVWVEGPAPTASVKPAEKKK